MVCKIKFTLEKGCGLFGLFDMETVTEQHYNVIKY